MANTDNASNGHIGKQGASVPLGHAPRGFTGLIDAISVADGSSDLPEGELERRLIELGFTEGATIEILHEGAFGHDPIAVRINNATVALRRREAMAILVI
ncbi:MAG TPA: FeoA family protein [Pseudolabrys sp.]|jgi:ferrous iron transport protein A